MTPHPPEQDWTEDWGAAPVVPPPARPRRLPRVRGRVSPVVAAAAVAAAVAAPFGVAATGDVLREGVRNGTSTKETEIIGRFNASAGAKGGYVTRQSNTQTGARAGGAAIYGCRGAAGGTAAGSAPCLRASNLANGLAFEFESDSGPVGSFTVSTAATAPFATNGRGVVENLNADLVDGRSASDFLGVTAKAADADLLDGRDSTTFAERLFAVVAEDGTVVAQRGLASTANVRQGEGFYQLEFDRDLRSCSVVGSTGAGNNGFQGGRIATVGKASLPESARNVNVRTQFFTGGAFTDDDNRFDVQVVC